MKEEKRLYFDVVIKRNKVKIDEYYVCDRGLELLIEHYRNYDMNEFDIIIYRSYDQDGKKLSDRFKPSPIKERVFKHPALDPKNR